MSECHCGDWDCWECGGRARRIEKPWRYETQKPMTEPPDINYRKIILEDQKTIDRLLENEDLHFTERCLRYQKQDVSMEVDILRGYKEWTHRMLRDACNNGAQARENFFYDLHQVVSEDQREVFNEWDKLNQEKNERERRRVAQKLGIPIDFEAWTTQDKQQFYDNDEYVVGWPNGGRDRYQAARSLGIPVNHEEWTSEDRQRFYEDDKYVSGWPNNERVRHQAARRLGIPANHEEWTTEDKRRYIESDNVVYSWPNRRRVREALEKLDQESSAQSLEDADGQQGEEESNWPTSDNEDNNDSLHLSSVNEEPSQPSHPATTAPKADLREGGRNPTIKAGLVPHTSDPEASPPLINKFRMGRGGRYYRLIAAILLILLLNEVIKQQLHLCW